MNRVDCLEFLAGRYAAKTYLEIGVRTGETFFAVRIPKKIGVDPVRVARRARLRSVGRYRKNLWARLFTETSDEFFAERARTVFGRSGVDLAFVDGKHTYEQALKDVVNTLGHLSATGIVVVHDVNPASAAQAWPAESPEEAFDSAPKVSTGAWCGDVWKAVVHLRAARPDIDVMTVPDDYGLAVINPRLTSEPIGLSQEEVPELSYEDLSSHRSEWLKLGSGGDFEAWLSSDPVLTG